MSLRSRLLAAMAAVALVLLVVSTVTTLTTRNQLISQIDDRLAVFSFGDRGGDGRLPFPEFDRDQDELPPPAPGELPVGRLSDVYQGYLDADGVVQTRFVPNVGDDQYGVPVVGLADVPASGNRTFTSGATDGDVTYRVLVQRFGDNVEVTAIPIDDVERTISRLVLMEVAGALVILAALGIVSWWVLHLGIRPVKQMTETATQIAAGDLTVRVPEGAAGTESGELAVALNQMLGHIEGAIDEREASQERLRRFVADASHELRTPVTTIRGYAELYRHGGLSEPEAMDDAMRRTEQEAARMGRLVEDMLTLAKLDEERPLDRRPVDLATLAQDAGSDARVAAPDRSIEVEVGDDPVGVDGDEDRLRQVIANVVGNALVHTDPDVPVTIRVSLDGANVVLEVEDRGGGMPAEVSERVTERFFRADPARSRHRGGSGLGLSIVDATMSAHGGAVDIHSTPGAGTRVRLVLPAAPQGSTSSDPVTTSPW